MAKDGRGHGRDPILNKKLSEALVEGVTGKRCFDAQNAIANGIHPDTLRNWLRWGLLPNAREPYKSFAEKYSKAQIQEESEILEIITVAAAKEWRAGAWFLEKKYPRRYGHLVPAAGPSQAIDVEALLKEATEQPANLIELLRNPPPELQLAMKAAAAEIRAFLDREAPLLAPEAAA